jgi:hypothetical protein
MFLVAQVKIIMGQGENQTAWRTIKYWTRNLTTTQRRIQWMI